MPVGDKFLIIREDYFRAAGDDFIGAAILNLVESLSNKQSGRPDGWAEMTIAFILDRTFGAASESTVHRKIEFLKRKKIIETSSRPGCATLYRLKIDRSKGRIDGEISSEQEAKITPVKMAGTALNLVCTSTVKMTPQYCQDDTPLYKEENSIVLRIASDAPQHPPSPKQSLPQEQSLSPRREKKLRTTREAPKEEKPTNPHEYSILVEKTKQKANDNRVSLIIEKTESNTNEGENSMNENVRAILKSYDRIPKAKRDRFCRGSIATLYKNHGDAIERITEQYGTDETLAALETFKADEYWQERGLPIRAFISQIEKYAENASRTPGRYVGSARAEEIAPCPVSASNSGIVAAAPRPLFDSQDREMRARKRRRMDDVLFMVKAAMPERVDELNKQLSDLDSVAPSAIEQWFTEALASWKRQHGGFEPSLRSKPVC